MAPLRQQTPEYKRQRSERRKALYNYARTVLGLGSIAARECSYSCRWMLELFPQHQFPQHIRNYAKMGVKRESSHSVG